MIKVLHLSSWDIGTKANLKVPFLYDQINEIGKISESSVITIIHTSFFKWLISRIKNNDIQRVFYLWEENENVNHYIAYLPVLPFNILGKNYYEVLFRTSKLLRQRLAKVVNPDIIHCHVTLNQGATALGLSQHLKIPFIIHEHSSPFSMHLNSIEKKEWTSKILQGAEKVICVGPALLQEVKKVSDTIDAIVIDNPIDETLFKFCGKEKESDTLKIISIGSFIDRKGHRFLFEAIRMLIDKEYNVHLSLVGQGDLHDSYLETIDKLGLNNNITFYPWQTRAELRQLICNNDIYVHSSLGETFGLAPLEALICGLPAVVTQCGGPEYYVNTENGVVVETMSSVQLAAGIEQVILNYSAYNMEEQSSYLAKKYSTSDFRSKIQCIYNEFKN